VDKMWGYHQICFKWKCAIWCSGIPRRQTATFSRDI